MDKSMLGLLRASGLAAQQACCTAAEIGREFDLRLTPKPRLAT